MPFTNQSEIDALALRSGDRRKPASSGHDRRGFRSGLILGAALCAGAAIALPAIITHPDRSITHEVAKSMGARDAKNATAPSKASEQRPAPEAKVAAPAPPAKPDAHAPGDPSSGRADGAKPEAAKPDANAVTTFPPCSQQTWPNFDAACLKERSGQTAGNDPPVRDVTPQAKAPSPKDSAPPVQAPHRSDARQAAAPPADDGALDGAPPPQTKAPSPEAQAPSPNPEVRQPARTRSYDRHARDRTNTRQAKPPAPDQVTEGERTDQQTERPADRPTRRAYSERRDDRVTSEQRAETRYSRRPSERRVTEDDEPRGRLRPFGRRGDADADDLGDRGETVIVEPRGGRISRDYSVPVAPRRSFFDQIFRLGN